MGVGVKREAEEGYGVLQFSRRQQRLQLLENLLESVGEVVDVTAGYLRLAIYQTEIVLWAANSPMSIFRPTAG
jgi:hypothetical protein